MYYACHSPGSKSRNPLKVALEKTKVECIGYKGSYRTQGRADRPYKVLQAEIGKLLVSPCLSPGNKWFLTCFSVSLSASFSRLSLLHHVH